VDEPVAINYLKRYAADFEKSQKERIPPYRAPETGRKIAVIGGGVEGLSTAFFSARLGHDISLFEAGQKLGGLLRTAIAHNRLPDEILDWDIEGILSLGISAHTGTMVRSAADLLLQGFEAVFLAVGGWDSRLTRTGGGAETGPAPGCHLLIDVAKAGSEGYPAMKLDGHVIVVGSPQIPADIITRCKALGAESVTLLVNEVSPMTTMPCEIIGGSGLSRLYGEGDRLTDMELTDLATGEKRKIEARHVLFSAGRIPELIFVTAASTEGEDQVPSLKEKSTAWEAFPPYKQPAQHHEVGLLSKGDVLADYSAAIKAIAAGRRAAVSIHKTLNALPLDLPLNVVTPVTPVQNVSRVFRVHQRQRHLMPLASAREAAQGAELERGFSAAEAKAEADRCLRCGLICYRHDVAEVPEAIRTAAAR
jgi:NADPH-dependent glutamate synthase beta subunit-like oxidoreductase